MELEERDIRALEMIRELREAYRLDFNRREQMFDLDGHLVMRSEYEPHYGYVLLHRAQRAWRRLKAYLASQE